VQTSQQELLQTYRDFSDDEIASLHAQIDSLTNDARAALALEIQRRGMSNAQMSKLRASELRREAKFDRRQKEHRKRVAFHFIGGEPDWFFWVLLGVLVAAAFFALVSSHR
jgi:hypothetical protein